MDSERSNDEAGAAGFGAEGAARRSKAPTVEKRAVAVVGCGPSGIAIAELCVLAGFPTTAIRDTPGDGAELKRRVLAALDEQRRAGCITPEERDSAAGRLRCSTDLGSATGADLVIESTSGPMPARQELLAEMENLTRGGALLAANASILPLRALAARLSARENFVGIHFFNPPVLIELCEVSSTDYTHDTVVEAAAQFARALGMHPLIVRDGPAYAGGRALVSWLVTAIHALEDGEDDPAGIDAEMALGRPSEGPFALADRVGLDAILAMAMTIAEEEGDCHSPPALLRRLVTSGQLGRSTGAGFYLYTMRGPVPNPYVLQAIGMTRRRAA
jgi:3-hydroxybutyryl-CoA dehydrogenase